MKLVAYIILIAALFIFLTGCGDDSPTQDTNRQELVLSGQLSDWTYGDSLYLSVTNESGTNPQYFLASAQIGPDGGFKLAAPAPPLEKLEPITEIYNAFIYSSSNITISDTAANFFRGYLALIDDDLYMGKAEWTDMSSVDRTAPAWKYYSAAYYYFDRDVIIKGSASCPACDGGYLQFNFSAKAGWNTILYGVNQNLISSYENYKPIDGKYEYSMVMYAPLTPINDSLYVTYPED